MLEAVVNISEGRRSEVIGQLGAACSRALLDVHSDVDHDRSVFTIAGRTPAETEAAVRRLADAVAEGPFGLHESDGVHPRLGILDVVPFVALDDTDRAVAVGAARSFARWLASTHQIPVFLYDDADPDHRTLPATRRDAFRSRAPDGGPDSPHPRLGAAVVGARRPMIAVNCDLDTDDVGLARRIARSVRERDGGLVGVRALGFSLATRGCAQVSMNLVNLDATGLESACSRVRELAIAAEHDVARVEIVGLVPASALAGASTEFRAWSGVTAERTIEAAMALVAAATGSAGTGGPTEP
ncbi:MAG: glutamate formimidoyltransferase [Acidimicrobiia bacterium]